MQQQPQNDIDRARYLNERLVNASLLATLRKSAGGPRGQGGFGGPQFGGQGYGNPAPFAGGYGGYGGFPGGGFGGFPGAYPQAYAQPAYGSYGGYGQDPYAAGGGGGGYGGGMLSRLKSCFICDANSCSQHSVCSSFDLNIKRQSADRVARVSAGSPETEQEAEDRE